MNYIGIKKLKYNYVIKRKTISSYLGTLSQYIHIDLTAVATVHIDKITENISYYHSVNM